VSREILIHGDSHTVGNLNIKFSVAKGKIGPCINTTKFQMCVGIDVKLHIFLASAVCKRLVSFKVPAHTSRNSAPDSNKQEVAGGGGGAVYGGKPNV
jgi:hypothetical protein